MGLSDLVVPLKVSSSVTHGATTGNCKMFSLLFGFFSLRGINMWNSLHTQLKIHNDWKDHSVMSSTFAFGLAQLPGLWTPLCLAPPSNSPLVCLVQFSAKASASGFQLSAQTLDPASKLQLQFLSSLFPPKPSLTLPALQ